MLLSRFWYLILSFALAAAAGILYIAHGFYNRHTERWMNEALMADSSAVAWYLKDDARNRASALVPVALAPDLREPLSKASDSNEISPEIRDKAKQALTKAAQKIDEELKFYALFAVDAEGRVVAQWNYAHNEGKGWNIGGHAVVADALAGWIRDDVWVIQEKMFRVVARPVERDGGGEPVGAIVGLVAVDAAYAQRVADATGAKIAFYVLGMRDVNALPAGAGNDPTPFLQADFDVMTSDIKEAATTEEYLQKGRSFVRKPRHDIGLVYTRVPGEAWDLGCGYIVARKVTLLKTPLSFFELADQTDKDRAPQNILIGIAIGLGLLGILFSIFEHTMPLRTFQRVAHEFAVGKTDTLAPSRFRGLYKKIAADINDGVDKALAKGGYTRRAADLEQVIGPLPAQPQMSAFAVPDATASSPSLPLPPSEREKSVPRVPIRPPVPAARPSSDGMQAIAAQPLGGAVLAQPVEPPPPPPFEPAAVEAPKPPPRGPGRPPPPAPKRAEEAEVAPASQPVSAPTGTAPPSPTEELADWKVVYEEFLKTKKQCGESVDGLTFERFKGTLERNKAALLSRHNCSGVKFTVYVKDGKAALRASPVK
ncbi:MAG: hypothetical protein HOW73_17860 [Polyangiaceae bacterium]|nr:hypothetical protein [Polyangiaceae bacterium]